MNDLMIPSAADVPAYVTDPEQARKINEEAAAGISTGFPARIKLAGGKFALVDGVGEEKAFPASKMFLAPDEVAYLPVVILRAKGKLSKQWFASAYNPAEEGKQPDCFSFDAERPDATSLAPQSETCAMCPHNAFGSGKDQAGNPTKGKACSDNKILAVFVPGFGVHMLKVPPGSLKNFGLYIKQLQAAKIPMNNIKTLVAFEPSKTTSELIFRFGGYLPEDTLPKVAELAESLETMEIISTPTLVSAPSMLEAPAPTTPVVDEPTVVEQPADVVADVIDMQVDATVATAAAAPSTQSISDQELRDELGL